MSFLAPQWLLLLIAVAALAAAYVVLQRRRRHYAVKFTTLEMLASVAPKRPGWRRHLSAALLGTGLVAMVFGLARPVRDQLVARETATLMLVVDVSGSMRATDVAPSRIDAAVAAAEAFVREVPAGFEVGLVAFDKTASVLATPSTDRGELLAALQTLTPGTGTATGDALTVALDAIESHLVATSATADASGEPTATIVLLSDGASTVGSSLGQAAQEAVDAGVPVTTIAYGTPAGSVTVEGQSVAVPADEAAMETLATTTGGSYFAASSSAQLASVYDTIQEHVGYTTEEHEVFWAFVALAGALLVAGVVAGLVWGGRIL